MGRYFGIGNRTQSMVVSGERKCWKGMQFCDCHEVMHRYKWNISDDIYSCSYDSYYKFVYNKEDNTMNDIDTTNEIFINSMSDKNCNQAIKEVGFKDDEDASDGQDESIANHAPKWDGDKCTVCNYQFNKNNIKKDRKKFNSVFCMN